MILALLLGGCARDPVKNFQEARVEAICSWYERCEGLTWAGYESESNCKTVLAAASKQSNEDMACDDFSQASADACVGGWEEADCETPPDLSACEDVCAG